METEEPRPYPQSRKEMIDHIEQCIEKYVKYEMPNGNMRPTKIKCIDNKTYIICLSNNLKITIALIEEDSIGISITDNDRDDVELAWVYFIRDTGEIYATEYTKPNKVFEKRAKPFMQTLLYDLLFIS